MRVPIAGERDYVEMGRSADEMSEEGEAGPAEVSAMATEEQREAIETILQRHKMRQNHRIIQKRLKRARTQLKFVIGDDRQKISGSDMPKAFVKYNAEHFQQPKRNGATAADGGDFCNSL